MTYTSTAAALALGASLCTAAGSARAQQGDATPRHDGYACFPLDDEALLQPWLACGIVCRRPHPRPAAIVRLRLSFVPQLIESIERM